MRFTAHGTKTLPLRERAMPASLHSPEHQERLDRRPLRDGLQRLDGPVSGPRSAFGRHISAPTASMVKSAPRGTLTALVRHSLQISRIGGANLCDAKQSRFCWQRTIGKSGRDSSRPGFQWIEWIDRSQCRQPDDRRPPIHLRSQCPNHTSTCPAFTGGAPFPRVMPDHRGDAR